MTDDAPDYLRYTESQLRQVLRDIDALRFPERVVQASQRLAHFELARKAVMPVGVDRKLISSSPSRWLLRRHFNVL
ncbi:hypothetical protein FHW58_002041 [Duganella sp. 1224]|uniref:hypothetical protein n=1 Tax=Duganella sp. 1224 TaxID=2587052 RepID=UPI0015C8577E|nr:hypothetical protein [Duganella sp. 1224]NYE60889.1 hypothetical protein [Duganella sp. 1224]